MQLRQRRFGSGNILSLKKPLLRGKLFLFTEDTIYSEGENGNMLCTILYSLQLHSMIHPEVVLPFQFLVQQGPQVPSWKLLNKGRKRVARALDERRAMCSVKFRRQACENTEYAGAVVVGKIGIFSVPSLIGEDGFYRAIPLPAKTSQKFKEYFSTACKTETQYLNCITCTPRKCFRG